MDFANNSQAWPFQEARAILKRLNNKLPEKGYVLFETGYGPSGLPHIGTFGEVVRTTMVRRAFELISGMPTKLWCVSDDIDGMRKVPDTIPNKEEYKQYFGWPLTMVPDPFGTHPSFGHNMNARLRAFLDAFGFEYEFVSATECYQTGRFNDMLHRVIEKYDDIMALMLPTLGEERQQTYSPFLPYDPISKQILQVPILEVDKKRYTITYKNLAGDLITSEVTDGKTKLQWKPDFGMRWAAFDVDFEIYGKDHLANGPIYTKICKILGGKAPHQSFYELFLDEEGKKISKSKGNGLTIDEWLRYAPADSLSYFMYLAPQKAKRLYFDVIPKCVDEYLAHLNSYHNLPIEKQIDNPLYHIHRGDVPHIKLQSSYSLLLNLVSACGSADQSVLAGYVQKFEGEIDAKSQELLDALLAKAMNYYQDFIHPHKVYRTATNEEKILFVALAEKLKNMSQATAEELQNAVYQIAKDHEFDIKSWFITIYEVLLGASSGPRVGTFIALYGVENSIMLIKEKVLDV